MGTTAFYYVPDDDGSYRRGRVRWDGYADHAGKYLVKFYSDLDKARALVSKGWIQYIDADLALIGQGETFFDGEDRLPSLDAALEEARTPGWAYVWIDGTWHAGEDAELAPLTRATFEASGGDEMRKWFADPNPPPKIDWWSKT